ncbi:MAG: SDR family oxidoreductase [Bacteroidetes bacterium]|nr:SDR family oxidoreductase [Bacteroidota bacterium]
MSPIPGFGLSVIKSAVASWTKALSIELGKYGITVNNVLPGPTDTKELKAIVNYFAEKENKTPSEYLKSVTERMPLKRIADASEIAEGVSFLSSEKASL